MTTFLHSVRTELWKTVPMDGAPLGLDFAVGMVPALFFLVWLGVVIYMIVLATRLVRGVERIARSLERDTRSGPPL